MELQRWIGGGAELAGVEEEERRGLAGDGAQSGPFIGNRKEDKHEKRPGDELGKRRSENGDDIGFSTAASEVARWGALGMASRELMAPAEAVRWSKAPTRWEVEEGGGALVYKKKV